MPTPIINLRKVKRKNGYMYMLDYTINGKRFRPTVGNNKREAEIIKADLQTKITRGHFDLISNEKKRISFNQLVDLYIAENKNYLAVKTLARYRNHILPFQDFINKYFEKAAANILMITENHINECVNQLFEGKLEYNWQPITINRMIEQLSTFFNFAIKHSYISKNPVKGVRKFPLVEKDVPEFYSQQELELIWENADSHWLSAFKFLYYTGIRKGELINLTWDKVELENDIARIRIVSSNEWRTKTKKTRVLELHKKAIKILEQMKGIHPNFVFTSKSNQKMHPNSIYKSLKTTLDKIGVKGDIHKFRHTFASNLLMKGATLFDLKELLGHANIETTMIYAHLSKEYRKNVVNLL